MGGKGLRHEERFHLPPFSPRLGRPPRFQSPCIHVRGCNWTAGREGAEQTSSVLDEAYPRHPAPNTNADSFAVFLCWWLVAVNVRFCFGAVVQMQNVHDLLHLPLDRALA